MVNADASFPAAFPAQGREAREPSDIGRRIADRYQIEQVSREDGLTCTVIARHSTLEERVTIQVLSPELRFDARRSAQYLDASKALARIKTDHVVRVLDVGVALYLGPFLVLEELEGQTLAQLLSTEGPLPVPRAVDYVLQACKGLAVAHAAGIVHRQLRTSRLLLARRGEFETLKVIDFPTLDSVVADVVAETEQRGYLAPEVMSGAFPVDRRADVWSLGAVLYELVTGRSALAQASTEAGAQEETTLSPALRRIISRCLQPEPEQRFADVDELAAELLPLTTMNEVFRGSLTGSFSRQMMMAAAAQARAAASAPPARPLRSSAATRGVWRARLRSAWSSLPFHRWPEGWREIAQRWQERMPPGGPALPHALLASGVLLLGLGYVWLGNFTLMPPPPGQRWTTPSVVTAALAPAPSTEPAAPPPPAEAAVVAAVPTVAAGPLPAAEPPGPLPPPEAPAQLREPKGKAKKVARKQSRKSRRAAERPSSPASAPAAR